MDRQLFTVSRGEKVNLNFTHLTQVQLLYFPFCEMKIQISDQMVPWLVFSLLMGPTALRSSALHFVGTWHCTVKV